jgi:hypothetical protein
MLKKSLLVCRSLTANGQVLPMVRYSVFRQPNKSNEDE